MYCSPNVILDHHESFCFQGKIHAILLRRCTDLYCINCGKYKDINRTSLKEYSGAKLVACVTVNGTNMISACKLMQVRVSC